MATRIDNEQVVTLSDINLVDFNSFTIRNTANLDLTAVVEDDDPNFVEDAGDEIIGSTAQTGTVTDTSSGTVLNNGIVGHERRLELEHPTSGETLVASEISFPTNPGTDNGFDGRYFIFDGPIIKGVTYTITDSDYYPTSTNYEYTYQDSNVVCFVAGVRIHTPDGPVAIEDLQVGDMVTTMDGGPRPIRWIGRRTFGAIELAANPKLRPIILFAGSLGHNLPETDMAVSRQHRMLVHSPIAQRMFGRQQVLVPAIKLTKIPGVCIDETTEAVEYFHLLLDQHEIIYSEGAPTESLFTGLHALKSLSYDAREEIATIFPEIAKRDHAPKPARYIPDGKKQKRLIERHLKTNKYVLHEQDTSI